MQTRVHQNEKAFIFQLPLEKQKEKRKQEAALVPGQR